MNIKFPLAMPNPSVSVIIPTYNNEATIALSIDSAISQTYPPLEIIVVNDGSTDSTKKILKPYIQEKKIRYTYQRNKGQGAARNEGAKIARGDWLAFLDADDEWLPEKLEIQLDQSRNFPQVALWSTGALVYENGVLMKEKKIPRDIAQPGNHYMKLLYNNCIVNSSVILKKQVFNKVGGFDESHVLRRVEDYDLWLKVALRFMIGGIIELLVKYTQPSREKGNANLTRPGLRMIYVRQLIKGPFKAKWITWNKWKALL